ncbi:hypothetical protein DFJ63DRAFT_338 [Scheffersomyces coipomensis]|uniref:uncharacterized protein n=1 Tax=Scheffersomyces coipomensis TaxID=1788519 RepID=UPI00315D2C64
MSSSRKTIPGALPTPPITDFKNGSNGNTHTNGDHIINHNHGNHSTYHSHNTNDHKFIASFNNYSVIPSCTHLNSVLETKAKETLLITYKQAVTLSKPIQDSNSYFTKKDGSKISNAQLINKRIQALKCSDCLNHNFQNSFMCLQCPHVGCCFNNQSQFQIHNHNHAYSHYKLSSHTFAIDSCNGLLYCFQCGNYINHPQLDKIRKDIYLNKVEEESEEEEEEDDDDEELDSDDNNDNYNAPNTMAITGLKGFVNLGATCFMSSILQTFIHNPILKYQFFNNDLHYFNCEKRHYVNPDEDIMIDENNACITCSIDNIFQLFYTSSSNEGYGMTNLLATAWYKNKSLAGFQEQDAHEFWQFILNEFHSDYERVLKNSMESDQIDDSGPLQLNHDNCHCVTHSTFSGELQSSIKCLSCETITTTIDPMVDLSLEINHLKNSIHSQQEIDLYDCLDLFTTEEKLDVKYSCRSCGDKTRAIKSLKLRTLPPILSIQLKRFKHNSSNDTSSKIEDSVQIPLYLNMNKYCVSQNENEDKFYELFALVCHIGSVNTGHYIVLIKNRQGEWFKFDDSIISMISPEEVKNTNAYLLFYITRKI